MDGLGNNVSVLRCVGGRRQDCETEERKNPYGDTSECLEGKEGEGGKPVIGLISSPIGTSRCLRLPVMMFFRDCETRPLPSSSKGRSESGVNAFERR